MSNIVVSVAIDSRTSRHWRVCAKLWAASLLRHQWDGKIVIGKNSLQPIFPVERTALKEIDLATGLPWKSTEDLDTPKQHSRNSHWSLAVEQGHVDGWVLLADADCIALRNLDHLLDGPGEIRVTRGEIDPGLIAVRGSALIDFIAEARKRGICNAVSSGLWEVTHFERGEVVRADTPGMSPADLAQAALIHFGGLRLDLKRRMAFAFHMMAVYDDKDGLFFDMMEA